MDKNFNTLTPEEWQQTEEALIEDNQKAVSERLAKLALKQNEERNLNPESGYRRIDTSRIFRNKYNERLKSSETEQSQDLISENNQKIESAKSVMLEFIQENAFEAFRQNRQLEDERINREVLLELETKYLLEDDPKLMSTRTPFTDMLRDDLDEIKEKKLKLQESSPEAFIVTKGLEFRKNVSELKNRKMITTPYVERNLKEVVKNMKFGQPTFIHGHLGGGKTELAITAAKKASVEKGALKETERQYSEWMNNNPSASPEEQDAQLTKIYKNNLNFIESKLQSGDSDAIEKYSPLLITGSKDMTSQDLYVDKTLKLTKFNGKSLLEHYDDLQKLYDEWEDANENELQKMASDEDRNKAKAEASQQLLELFKLKNQAFGTEVETIKKELLKGVIEGRPVIIDEVNAIPSAVLISLNDVLQRRPGENCYIPGYGSVKVADGFSITMTGNLSDKNVGYEGTNSLNVAFESRLDKIAYNYLPQSIDDEGYLEQANPDKNELFRVLVSYLADDKGNLSLPEMDKSLSKIFRLAQLARVTQDVFSGNWSESHTVTTASGDERRPRLEKSVLSVRNLLMVLKEWDTGSEQDLDMALWNGFVKGITNANDQSYVLSQALRFGFFDRQDGWKVEARPIGSPLIESIDQIRDYEYSYQRKPKEIYTMAQTVEMLFGKAPERTNFPEFDFTEMLDQGFEEEVTLEEYEKIRKKIEELSKVASALEKLAEKGCPANLEPEA